MNALDRVTDALVRRAALRWPPDMAESLLREWRAELASLQARPQTSAVHRIWRQIAFAVSLACSPTTEPRTSMGRGWARVGSTVGWVGRRLVGSFGVALLATFVAGGMGDLADQLVNHNRYDIEPASWWYITAHVGTTVVGLALVSLVAVFVGTAIRRGRRTCATGRSWRDPKLDFAGRPAGARELSRLSRPRRRRPVDAGTHPGRRSRRHRCVGDRDDRRRCRRTPDSGRRTAYDRVGGDRARCGPRDRRRRVCRVRTRRRRRCTSAAARGCCGSPCRTCRKGSPPSDH